jgi:hypothetical protein
MDLSGPGIYVKLKERKKERKKERMGAVEEVAAFGIFF